MLRKTLTILSLICLMISFWAWLVCYDTQSRRLRLHYSDPQTGQPRWLVGLTAEKGYLSLDHLHCRTASVTKFMFDGRWRTVLWRPRAHVTLMWTRTLIFTMTTPGVPVSNYYYALPRLSSRGGWTRLYIPLYMLMTLSVVIFAWAFGVPLARRLRRERKSRSRTSRWHRWFTLKTATYTSFVALMMSSGCWSVSYANVKWARPQSDTVLKLGCFQWLYFNDSRIEMVDPGLSVGGLPVERT